MPRYVGVMVTLLVCLQARAEPPRRTGLWPMRVLVFGDQRPDCKTGAYSASVQRVLARVAAESAAADVVVATGDYLCAWDGADQREKALAQMRDYTQWLTPEVRQRTLFAEGNHELTQPYVVAATLTVTPRGWQDFRDLRVVWLPSAIDRDGLDPTWLDRALAWPGRLVVVRHEPWGAIGTHGDGWIRDRVRAARPSLVLHGHVHTFALPRQRVADLVPFTLGPAEVIVGNGGAPGWETSVGWAGVAVIDVRPDGTSTVRGIDDAGAERVRGEVKP